MPAQLRLVPADPIGGGQSRPGGGPDRRTGNGSERPPTILVAEDEVLLRMAVAQYLRECGYRVLEAAHAAEAIALFRAGEPIEIMLSDVQMPGEVNGFGLATWVRQHHPDVRVILASGVESAARQASEVCADSPFLHKPYSYEDLIRHIRKLLGPPS